MGWTLYLFLTIVLVGLPGTLSIYPFIITGRFNRKLELISGRAARRAIKLMFDLNLWIPKDVKLTIPYEIGRSNRACLMFANHRSTLDVFFLISYIPNIRLVAKWQLFFIPYFGLSMRVMRQIPWKRGRFDGYLSVLADIEAGLKNGDPILIFPEGRRCTPGMRGIGDFQEGIFRFAHERGIEVWPIIFSGTDRVWSSGSMQMHKVKNVCVRGLDPIPSKDYPTASAFMAAVSDKMTAELERLQ